MFNKKVKSILHEQLSYQTLCQDIPNLFGTLELLLRGLVKVCLCDARLALGIYIWQRLR